VCVCVCVCVCVFRLPLQVCIPAREGSGRCRTRQKCAFEGLRPYASNDVTHEPVSAGQSRHVGSFNTLCLCLSDLLPSCIHADALRSQVHFLQRLDAMVAHLIERLNQLSADQAADVCARSCVQFRSIELCSKHMIPSGVVCSIRWW